MTGRRTGRSTGPAIIGRRLPISACRSCCSQKTEGGAGASLAEAAAAIEALGGLGDPSPAADTAVLAWLVSRQGATVPDGPMVLAEAGCRVAVAGPGARYRFRQQVGRGAGYRIVSHC